MIKKNPGSFNEKLKAELKRMMRVKTHYLKRRYLKESSVIYARHPYFLMETIPDRIAHG